MFVILSRVLCGEGPVQLASEVHRSCDAKNAVSG